MAIRKLIFIVERFDFIAILLLVTSCVGLWDLFGFSACHVVKVVSFYCNDYCCHDDNGMW